jgi:hypothetical protein
MGLRCCGWRGLGFLEGSDGENRLSAGFDALAVGKFTDGFNVFVFEFFEL